VEQRCRIWGFDAPKRLELSGALSVSAPVEAPPSGLSPEELVLLAELAEKAGVLGPPPTGDFVPYSSGPRPSAN
jgi:hypothetical protein